MARPLWIEYPGASYPVMNRGNSRQDIFIRLRLNTLQLAAGMKGEVNRAEARKSVGGLGYDAIPL
jgi:hypothetical protein